MKKAIVTGVTGQDGSYLVELLLSKGYIVHGIKRRASSFNHPRLEHILQPSYPHHENFFLHYGDLTDIHSIMRIVKQVEPDEIYNLAAQSHVAVSFEMPMYSAQVDAIGTLNILEAIRLTDLSHKTRFYQASTSELYGKVQEVPQKETTPFYPRSPYAVAKLMSYWAVINYREAYGIFAVNGILFNHESPRRGETFVTRKITRGVAMIKHGMQSCIQLGNLDAKRDWGHARDYVDCMWRMLQVQEPEDWVVATGVATSVRDFCNKAFAHIDMPLRWIGEGVHECGVDSCGNVRVEVSPQYFRPTEVEFLLGDSTKAQTKLRWNSQTTSLDALVKEMVDADLQSCKKKCIG